MFKQQLYMIPEWEKRDLYAKWAKTEGLLFEYNDFFHPSVLDSKEETERLIKGYLSLERDTSKDTLHGAFLDITINSSDLAIRTISRKRVHQSMDIAKTLGIRAVIFHTNLIPGFKLTSYLDQWVADNGVFWREILQEYDKQSIYMENMFDQEPYMLARLAEEMKEENRFGVCFDYAHARISGTPISVWNNTLKPYVKHIHINDNNGEEDLHQALGFGNTNWQEFRELMSGYSKDISILLEVKGEEKIKQSLDFCKKQKLLTF